MEIVSWAQQNPQMVLGFGGAFLFLFVVSIFILLKQNDKIKKLEATSSQNRDSIVELEAQKAELETQLKAAAEEGAEKDNRLNELQVNVGELQEKVEEMENGIADRDAEIAELKNALGNAESTLAEAVEERDNLKYDNLIAILYIKLKTLADEFYTDFSQDILKGIATMNVAELDLVTAQNIFNMALELHKKSMEETALDDEV